MINLSKKDQKMLAAGLLLAVVFVVVGVLVFSYARETLDLQAKILGAEDETVWEAPFPDYAVVGFENEVCTILLGIVSTLAIFGVTLGVAMLLKKPKGQR
jgi:hypothetical protein